MFYDYQFYGKIYNVYNFINIILQGGTVLSIFSNFPLFVVEVIDILYKVSMIIALFYTTKALRVYIDKNSRKQ